MAGRWRSGVDRHAARARQYEGERERTRDRARGDCGEQRQPGPRGVHGDDRNKGEIGGVLTPVCRGSGSARLDGAVEGEVGGDADEVVTSGDT